jgi:transposase
LSVQQATWLFFRKPDELKEEELERLRLLRQASPTIETTYQLVKLFLQMVRERTGEQLDSWLAAVQASHLEAFASFVTGVQQDKDAVLAGLTLEWSNGPLEGNVTRRQHHQKKHVRSRRNRSAQASRAPSQQKGSGQKEQEEQEATEESEKQRKLSACHNN